MCGGLVYGPVGGCMIWCMSLWSGGWLYGPVYSQVVGVQCGIGVMVWQVGTVRFWWMGTWPGV